MKTKITDGQIANAEVTETPAESGEKIAGLDQDVVLDFIQLLILKQKREEREEDKDRSAGL